MRDAVGCRNEMRGNDLGEVILERSDRIRTTAARHLPQSTARF